MNRQLRSLSVTVIGAITLSITTVGPAQSQRETDVRDSLRNTISETRITIAKANLIVAQLEQAVKQTAQPLGALDSRRIATVDLVRVQAEFKAKNAIERVILQTQQAADNMIYRRAIMPLLSAAEHEELDSLMSKPQANRYGKQQARVQALTEKSERLDEEYRQAKVRTSTGGTLKDLRQLQQLNRIKDQTVIVTEKLKQKQNEKLTAFVASKSDRLFTAIESAVNKVAQAKGFTTIMNDATAPGESAKWPDITDEVIAELNKQAQ